MTTLAAAAVVAASPPAASAGLAARAHPAAAVGEVFGGFTAQAWPVVFQLDKAKRRIIHAGIALHTTCTSGNVVIFEDDYTGLPIGKKRRFGSSFGPDTTRNDDGTTSDYQGSISGTLNPARTRMSGTWRLTVTDYDLSGVVKDTCESGAVKWTARR